MVEDVRPLIIKHLQMGFPHIYFFFHPNGNKKWNFYYLCGRRICRKWWGSKLWITIKHWIHFFLHFYRLMIDRFVNTHDLTHFPNNCFTFVWSNMENFTCDWFLFYFILYLCIKMEIIGPSLNQLLLFHWFFLQAAHHSKLGPVSVLC